LSSTRPGLGHTPSPALRLPLVAARHPSARCDFSWSLGLLSLEVPPRLISNLRSVFGFAGTMAGRLARVAHKPCSQAHSTTLDSSESQVVRATLLIHDRTMDPLTLGVDKSDRSNNLGSLPSRRVAGDFALVNRFEMQNENDHNAPFFPRRRWLGLNE